MVDYLCNLIFEIDFEIINDCIGTERVFGCKNSPIVFIIWGEGRISGI